jgi:hypothetical protein
MTLFSLLYRGACDGNVALELLLDVVVRRPRIEDRTSGSLKDRGGEDGTDSILDLQPSILFRTHCNFETTISIPW